MAAVPMLLLAFLVGLGRAGGAPSPARTYYVSPAGSDEGPGDAARPFQTIQKCIGLVKPGDKIVIRAGTYPGPIILTASGEPGKPIVFEGERGRDGEWLTVIDGARPLHAKWVPAPEAGAGVFKTPFPGFEPQAILVDGRFIPRLWPQAMKDGRGFQTLGSPETEKVKTIYLKAEVSFWDTVGAMFGCKDGTVYLRFRGGDDLNEKSLRAAPGGGGVGIENQNDLVFRDLMVRGGHSCVFIKGPQAQRNVIQRCRLVNAAKRVYLTDGASHNVIRDNEITIDFYAQSCKTGAWGCSRRGGDVPYELGLKEHFYNAYKYLFGPNSTSDYGIRLYRVGPGNEVYGNRVFRGGQGISVHWGTDVAVHDNTVHGFSSIGIICTLNNVANVRIHDNLVYACNINLRIHHVNEPRQTARRSLFVYGNRFYEPPGVGTHVFFHYFRSNDVTPYKHADISIYHNSFCGGRAGLKVSAYAAECGGLPQCLVVNNVVSSHLSLDATTRFIASSGMFGAFDYNWLGGRLKSRSAGYDFTRASWYGGHNIFQEGARMWDESKRPDFRLPTDSPAKRAGTDLSRPFTVNGKRFGPFHGLEPGYFSGSRPDLGALWRPRRTGLD